MSTRIVTAWSKQLPKIAPHPGGASAGLRAAATSCHLRGHALTPPPSQATLPSSRRAFSTTPIQLRKSGKANLSHARSDSSPPVNDAGPPTPTDQAYDLSVMESQILKAIEHLTHELSELRAGGRLNPENIEKLKVTLKPSGSAQGGKETHRLSDLAQVIPKGRIISIVAGDVDYVKPLMTAIQASPYSLTPQAPKPDQPTTITVPIPPPTGESRRKALDAAKKAEATALQAVQTARAAHQKKLRSLETGKQVRPDDINKARKLMDETAQKGQTEVKHIVEGSRKVLEST